jgi:hypothetical protein
MRSCRSGWCASTSTTTGKVAGFRIDCPIADFDFGALDFRAARKGE